MSSKKLCIFLSNSHPPDFSAYNVQEVGLAKALHELGWSVDILVFSKRKGCAVRVVAEAAWGRLLEYDGWALPGHQAMSQAGLRWMTEHANDYDVIQVHDCTQLLAVLVARIAKQRAVPCVLYQGMYRDHTGLLKTPIHWIYNRLALPVLFRSIAVGVAKTEAALHYLERKGLPDNCPRSVIPVALDVDVFKEVGACERDIDVLYVGRLEPRRNTPFLISMIKNLHVLRPSLKFCVVGDGVQGDLFKRELACEIDAGVVEYVACVKNSEIARYYARSRVFVFPTHYEIFGMAVLEAMNFGACVIASNEAGPGEVIENAVSGFLVDGFCVEEWQGLILSLTDSLVSEEALRVSAKSRFYEYRGWGRRAEMFCHFYDDLVKGNDRGAC